MTFSTATAAPAFQAPLPLSGLRPSSLFLPSASTARTACSPPPVSGAGSIARRKHGATMVDQQVPPKVSPVPTGTPASAPGDILELTWDNVDMVLDEMRPYLMSDGGNVSIAEIDGATVRLQLEGACGSCPSSTMTMKMGLERRLRERIPEIVEVVQVEPEGPELTAEGIEQTLDEVRPFLNVAGGTIELLSLHTETAAPTAHLRMTGSGAAINSVKVEIVHRLKRNWVKLVNVTFD